MKEKIIEPIKAWWAKVDAFFTEHKKTVKLIGLISLIVTVIAALVLTIVGIVQVNRPIGEYEPQGTVTMISIATTTAISTIIFFTSVTVMLVNR